MRKAIKKPITPDAIQIALRKLDSLRSAGNDARAVLEQSTMNCWQGLFDVKSNQARGSPAKESRHSGFEKIDYSEGVTDGRIN